MENTYEELLEGQIREEERIQLQNIIISLREWLQNIKVSLTRSTRGSSTASEARRRSTRETTRRETSKSTRRRGATYTSSGTTKTNGQTPTSGFANTRACGEGSGGASSTGTGVTEARRGVGGRRTINGARDDLSAANDGQTESSLFLRLDERGV